MYRCGSAGVEPVDRRRDRVASLLLRLLADGGQVYWASRDRRLSS
jgi:hypothetical protein